MKNQKEYRNLNVKVEYRSEEDGSAPKIRGYAVVYETRSNPGARGDFAEIFRPGALTRSLKENPNIYSAWNHNADLILGRTTAGTLRVEEDEKGLRFEIDPPNSPNGQNAMVAIQRGDVTEMSFGFMVREEKFSNEGGKILREVLDADIFEISPVISPAYPGTSVELRSEIDELLKKAESDSGDAEEEVEVKVIVVLPETEDEDEREIELQELLREVELDSL